jgi:ribosomal protein S18 acetylase RimI-like enzyme
MFPGNMVIKKANLGDVNLIYSIFSKSFTPEHLKIGIYHSPKVKLYLIFQLLRCYLSSNKYYIKISVSGKDVGCFEAYRLDDYSLFLSYIAILPEFQGKGFGNLLISTLENLATKGHQKQILLDVSEHNPGTLAWYSKMGYERIGKRYVYEVDLENQEGNNKKKPPINKCGYYLASIKNSLVDFSKFYITVNNNRLKLGLLGKHIKILSNEPNEILEIITRFDWKKVNRKSALIFTDKKLPPNKGMVRINTLNRMRKKL